MPENTFPDRTPPVVASGVLESTSKTFNVQDEKILQNPYGIIAQIKSLSNISLFSHNILIIIHFL